MTLELAMAVWIWLRRIAGPDLLQTHAFEALLMDKISGRDTGNNEYSGLSMLIVPREEIWKHGRHLRGRKTGYFGRSWTMEIITKETT